MSTDLSATPLGDTATGRGPAAAPLRACMLAYTFYENDGRVIRYAEALAEAGAQVDVIALRRPGQAACETLRGVRVLRIQTREKNEKGKRQYLTRLLAFLLRSAWVISREHLRRRYHLVHVHSVPDFEVFAAALPKLLGARLILDIHDIVPEFYAAKFKVSEQSAVFRLLKLVEKASTAFADHVIIANHLWQRTLTQRAVPPAKCSAYINYPDTQLFRPTLRQRPADAPFTLLYPGTLNWHQGLDIAIEAFALALPRAPGMRFEIYGEGPSAPQLREMIERLGLQGQVQLHPPRPLREIAQLMANADLGVVPKRNDAFGGDAFSTKVLEFMALGVPLLVARTRVDKHYFDDSLLRFFTPGEPAALAEAMVAAWQDQADSAARAERALAFAQAQSWEIKRHDYLALVRRLTGERADAHA